jgi:hypothetical protein
MPINVDQFASVLPSGNFFSDPRLPNNLQSSGARYAPTARPSPVAGGGGGGLGGGAPSLPDFSEIGNLIGQINATNQAAQHAANAGRIPGASQLEQLSSNSIANLLNPPTQIGEIDTGAAARALDSGTSGSPFAGHMGILLNENERIRRQGIGQQFLTGALARNPAAPIADTQQLLQFIQQQRFQAEQTARNRDFEGQQNALNRAMQAQLAFLNQNRNHGYGPHLPTSYGRPSAGGGPFSANIPSGVDPYYNPEDYAGTTWDIPGIEFGQGEAWQGDPNNPWADPPVAPQFPALPNFGALPDNMDYLYA